MCKECETIQQDIKRYQRLKHPSPAAEQAADRLIVELAARLASLHPKSK